MDLKVEGAGELVNRLYRFDRDVYTILLREVRSAVDVVADEAKVQTPDQALSNWGKWDVTTGRNRSVGSITQVTGSRDLSFDSSTVRSSIKRGARKSNVRRGGTTGVVGWVGIRSAGGAIFTLAGGAKRRPSTNSRFVKAIRAKWGEKYPRILGPAWHAKAHVAGDQIDAALERAKRAIGL